MRRHPSTAAALFVLVLAAGMLCSGSRAAPPALVNATLEPSQIALGETAELTITRSGNSMEALDLPKVPGLEFRVVGQSHRISMINGVTLVTTSLVVRVTPSTVGIFTIPGITPASQPLVLRVNPEGTVAPPGRNSLAGRLAGPHADGLRMTADGSAYIRLIVPKREIFVGESIPVGIEVGLRDGFVKSLNGLPTLSGGDFTLNNLSHQPERVQKLIDGREYTLLTWRSVLAAVKPGTFSLAVTTPLTVRIRTRPQKESAIEDMLGDPFMQNFFGATVQKDITVTSPTVDLSVLPLPMEDRPRDFSGAVGSFQISGALSAAQVTVGDPLTLRMRISGSGNFDRVDSPLYEHLEGWKTYPPKATFKATDPLGHLGEKTFEQPLIAAAPGEQTLPPLAFSYFDPATRRYETVHSAPLSVAVAQSPAERASSAPGAGGATAAPPPTAAPGLEPSDAPADGGLRPDHTATATLADLEPLYFQRAFLALPTLVAFAFTVGWLRLRRAPRAVPRRARRRTTRTAEHLLRDIEAAARAGNAAQFFSLSRRALGLPIGANLAAESEEVRQIVALADEASYGGAAPAGADLDRWTAVMRRRLTGETSP